MVATSNIITTSLQIQFWPKIRYDGVEQAGVGFAKSMNKMSQDGRGVADAMTAQDVTNRRKADLNLRNELRKLITEISPEQMAIHQLTCRSNDDAKWGSVADLVKA